jgi:peroxin-1
MGKSYFVLTLAATLRMQLSYSTIYLDCQRLQSVQTKMEHLLNEMTQAFMQATKLQPSLLLLDSLDTLIPNTGSSSGLSDDSANRHQHINPMLISQCKVLADHLKFLMSGSESNEVVIICTCQDENKLHMSLRTVDTFTSKIHVPTLSESEKVNLFFDTMNQHGSRLSRDGLDLKNFSKQTEHFSPRDLKVVATKTALKNQMGMLQTPQKVLTAKDIDVIISGYTPLTQQALHLNRSAASIKLEDIGGLFEAKSSLSSVILRPIKYNFIYKHAPISLPKGILLYGFPGCGKSCIVPAIAQECGFNLVTCRGPELLDKFIGASEAKVRELFERAYAAAPSVLFLDEFDALAPRRGSDNTGVTDRVVNQLLTFLDGVEDHGSGDDKIVYIIAASSRPDKIDPALLRPGRLEKHIFIGYPQSEIEFDDLVCKIAKTRQIDNELKSMLADSSLRDNLSSRNCKFLDLSPADIQGVFDTAHLSAVHDLLRIRKEQDSAGNANFTITSDHLISAFECTRPSISMADRQMFSRTFSPFLGIDVQSSSPDGRKLKTALK